MAVRVGKCNSRAADSHARVVIISQQQITHMITQIPAHQGRRSAYLRCLDCHETFDYWKYDSLVDTSHDGHRLRALTREEFSGAASRCADDECED